MSHTFLDHLLLKDELIADLDLHSLGEEDRQELLDLIDQIFHHHAMDTIFTGLVRPFSLFTGLVQIPQNGGH